MDPAIGAGISGAYHAIVARATTIWSATGVAAHPTIPRFWSAAVHGLVVM
jgi:hypothetical protein